MPKLPKEIRDVTKQLDRARFSVERRTKHFAICDRATGELIVTVHCNHGDRGRKNQLAELKRLGLLKEGR